MRATPVPAVQLERLYHTHPRPLAAHAGGLLSGGALSVPTAAAVGEQQGQAPSLSPSPANLIALAPAAAASSSPALTPAAASPLDAFPGFWVAQPAAAPLGSDAALDTASTPAPGQGAAAWERSQQGQLDQQATPDLGCLGPKQAQQQLAAAGLEASLAAAVEPGQAAAGLAGGEGGEQGVRQEQGEGEGPDRRERKVS